MANTIQLKRGLESARTGFTPAAGEPLYVTDTGIMYIGDGSTLAQNLLPIASGLDIVGDTGTDSLTSTDSLSVLGGTSLSTTVTNNTITVNVDADSITYNELQNVVANNVLLGNDNGAGFGVQELTATEVRTLLNVEDGANNYNFNIDSDIASPTAVTDGSSLVIAGGTNVTTSHAGNTVTINVSGAGTMDSFSVSGDAGDASDVIGDTETLNIVGGDSITTTLNATTTTLTVAHDAHTGDVTGSTALTIAGNAVTYAKMQNTSVASILGNTAGAGAIGELSAAAVRTFTGTGQLSGTSTVSGGWTFSTAATTFNSNLNLADNTVINIGSGNDVKHFFNATSYITELESVNWIIRNSVDAAIVTITESTGQVDFAGAVVIDGDLTVNGTTTTINTTQLLVEDNIVTLNSTYAGSAPTANAGIEVERGTLTNATLQWNETGDYWEVDKADSSFSEIATLSTLSSYLQTTSVDDVPVDGATTDPISSNWAFDHIAAADPHNQYALVAGAETITGVWTFTNATFDGGTF